MRARRRYVAFRARGHRCVTTLFRVGNANLSPMCATSSTSVAEPPTPRRRGLERRLRSLLVVSHRWTALIVGLLLVVVSTSGALIVYEPEMLRASNSELFHSTPADHAVSFGEAVDAVG